MPTITLSTLQQQALLSADMANSTFIASAESVDICNQSIRRWRDILEGIFGDEYFLKDPPSIFTTLSGQDLYSLPADFYKVGTLYWLVSGSVTSGQWARIPKYTPVESEMQSPSQGWTGYPYMLDGFCASNVKYRLQGSSVRFVPTPRSTHTIKLNYVPFAADLALPGDALETFGFDRWLRYDIAAQYLEKEESDSGPMLRRRDDETARMRDLADRNLIEPPRIQDTRPGGYFEGW